MFVSRSVPALLIKILPEQHLYDVFDRNKYWEYLIHEIWARGCLGKFSALKSPGGFREYQKSIGNCLKFRMPFLIEE